MAAEKNQRISFDPAVLDLLACPTCLGGLALEEVRLVCGYCGRAYPIVNGIPVLITEQEISNQNELGRIPGEDAS